MSNWDQRAPYKWKCPLDLDRWRRLVEARRMTPRHGILLGDNVSTQLPVYITPYDLRTHMHIVGSTGVGKSFFMEAILKQLILQGHGICLIDPHGDLYHRLLQFCAYLNVVEPELHLERRVIPFNIAETRHVLGFNPVQRNARVMTYQIVALMEAIRKCFGADSFTQTPRLARWLFNAGYAVVDGRATLLQAYDMVDPKANPYRTALVKRIADPQIRGEWEWINAAKMDKREERLESTFNRIREFVAHETIRLIVGQYTRTLDFTDVIRGRKILLVNLSRQNTISEDNQHLIGTLLVNELLTSAFAMPSAERTDFYLAIDEFGHFVTKDMCEILDGGRKFKLHLIMAHQHLNQLKVQDPEVYYSTLTNARAKCVFGGLIDEDLDVVAPEMFELDPNAIKDEIWQTKFRPVETTRVISAKGSSHADITSLSSITHQSLMIPENGIPGSAFISEGQSTSSVQGTAEGFSTSETVVPWYEFHEFKELSSRQFRALEEQLYIKKAQLKRQPGQHVAILIPGDVVQLARVPTLKDLPVRDRDRSDFLRACFESAGCFKTPEDAEREIATLKRDILSGTSAPPYQLEAPEVESAPPPPLEDDDWDS